MKTKNQNNMITCRYRDKACLVLILGIVLAAGIITVSAQADKKQAKFVVVAGGNSSGSDRAAYSVDGINWSRATMPYKADWSKVCYGNGKFVAVAGGISVAESAGVYYRKLNNKAAYSEDGINWKIAALPYEASWIEVCYGNGKFIAIAGAVQNYDGEDKFIGNLPVNMGAYSEDGINWKAITLPDKKYWRNICYGNGKFVITGADIVAYSNNGINWKSATLPDISDGKYWSRICYGNGKFIAVVEFGNIAAYSNDGIIWRTTILPNDAWIHNICYGNGKFIEIPHAINNYDAEGYMNSSCSNKTAYSEDGIIWQTTTLPTSMFWISLCYGNGKFIAINGTNIAVYSNDGINWKVTILPDLPIKEYWRSICYGDD